LVANLFVGYNSERNQQSRVTKHSATHRKDTTETKESRILLYCNERVP